MKGKIKKSLCMLLALASVCTCSAALAGCGSSERNEGATAQSGRSLGLSYEKTYSYDWKDQYTQSRSEFVFHENGTGEYRRFYKNIDSQTEDYTVTFKYLYYAEENTAFAFYDSVKYGEAHTRNENVESRWHTTLLCTKELLRNPDGIFYICEDYRPTIPNYGVFEEE